MVIEYATDVFFLRRRRQSRCVRIYINIYIVDTIDHDVSLSWTQTCEQDIRTLLLHICTNNICESGSLSYGARRTTLNIRLCGIYIDQFVGLDFRELNLVSDTSGRGEHHSLAIRLINFIATCDQKDISIILVMMDFSRIRIRKH